MCKVLIIPRITDSKRELILEFTTRMAMRMSTANSDGLGYAAVDAHGNLFGERWLRNSDFWTPEQPPLEDHMSRLFGEVATSYKYSQEDYGSEYKHSEYSRFGEGTLDQAAAITLHARMATSGKGHTNTHPFYYADEDSSVIHNGVIRNTEDFKFRVSTCDSEAILVSYLNNKVNLDATQVNAMAKELVGYYVAAMFSRDSKGERILDIAKAHNNNLTGVWVPEFDTYVISTASKDLQEVLDSMGLARVGMRDFKDGVFLRIRPVTGDIVSTINFTVGDAHPSRRDYTPTVVPGPSRALRREESLTMGKNLTKELMEYFQHTPHIEQLKTLQ